ncbi:MAG TPA: hypothetical protein VFW65_34640 [Pseudonocardiaceae bacterium]|nr:hypothetical protein [Pseudonocardiaceae bacterium]
MNADERREHAQRLVADWPPLTAQQRHQLGIQLRRRRDAAGRCEPLADGQRDPRHRRRMTRESELAARQHLAEAGLMSEVVDRVLHESEAP